MMPGVKADLQDQFLYCGKHRPSLYLDEHIRHGISSFSNLANSEEVQRGLKSLAEDIKKGIIADIMASYPQDAGDYMFLIGRKP